MSKRFDKITRLFKGEGYGQDPDAAQDIDQKQKKKRKPGDYVGGVPSLDSTPATKEEGFGYVFKGTGHPGFNAVAQSIAERSNVSVDEAKAMLASSTRGASAAAKKKNPRLKRV